MKIPLLQKLKKRKPVGRKHVNDRPTAILPFDPRSLTSVDGLTNAQIQQILEPHFDLEAEQKTNTLRLLLDTAQIYGTFVITGAALYTAAHFGGLAGAAAALPLTALFNARALRGAEHYVHEGSHYSVIRAPDNRNMPRVNDFTTDVLFSSLVAQTVKGYRRGHLGPHHGGFGSPVDPCKRMRAGLAELVAAGEQGPVKLARTLIKILPAYCSDYYREVGSRKQALRRFAVLHTAVIAGLGFYLGFEVSLALWSAVFLLPFATVLQALRALGEASEHDYSDPQKSEAAATYNNLGWVQRMFVNPFNDAYHWVHHMWLRVPSYNYVRIHRVLTNRSPVYRLVRTRHRLLERA